MTLKIEDLIIDKPELAEKKDRIISAAAFFTFWAMFLYLLRPILVLTGWVVMGYFANLTLEYDYFIEEVLLDSTALAIYAMMIVFPLWAFYNRKMFGGHRDKRSRAKHLKIDDEIFEDFNVPIQYKNTILSAKKLDVRFDDDANITGFSTSGKKVNIG